MASRRKDKRTSRLSAVISLVLHGIIIGALVFIAAREGILGKDLKKIAVTIVPKEKPPEEKPPEPKPEIEEPKPDLPKPVIAPRTEVAKAVTVPQPVASAAPAAAPAAAMLPAFDFEGGKAVESTSDPSLIYKGFVEYTLRARWNRPEGVADDNYIVEVEVALDRDGRIQGTTWQRGSGDAAWDNSVKQVLAETATIGRPPPNGFPHKVLVRFDVQVASAITLE